MTVGPCPVQKPQTPGKITVHSMRQPADSYREPAFLRVANAMQNDILTGRLSSGASLIEAELTAIHGVSRNTLREAMHLLHQQGLVSHEPNRSVRVKKLTRADIRDIFVVRRVVETGALRNRTTVSAIQLEGLHTVCLLYTSPSPRD